MNGFPDPPPPPPKLSKHYVCPGSVEVAGWTVDQEIRVQFPALPSPYVGPLMARMLKTSLDILVPLSGQ